MTTELHEAQALGWFVGLCESIGLPMSCDLDLHCAYKGELFAKLEDGLMGLRRYKDGSGRGRNASVKLWHTQLPVNWYFDYTGEWEGDQWVK